MAESILSDPQPSPIAAVAGNEPSIEPGSEISSRTPAATPAQRLAPTPFAEAVEIMARLRAPDGCPWDREQTFDTIKRHTLEETYEVFDAIERRAWPELKDELGDLLLQVLFYAQMAAEEGHFDITDVVANLNAKLIRRHPHIFANTVAADADAVLRNWEQIKRAEKKQAKQQDRPSASLLDDVPRSMPAVLEAAKLGSKAAKVGFDWPDPDGRATGLFEKLQEEIAELQAEIAPEPPAPASPRARPSRPSWATCCLPPSISPAI